MKYVYNLFYICQVLYILFVFMIYVSVILLLLATIFTVFMPWFAPLLFTAVMHLIDLGISPVLIVAICSVTATMTTTWIRFLIEKIHIYCDKYLNKTVKNKKWFSWHLRKRFDRKFSMVNNKFIIFLAIMFASGSMIPDAFLVEFWRIKLKYPVFITAIFIWKVMAYSILVTWFDKINYLIKSVWLFLGNLIV